MGDKPLHNMDEEELFGKRLKFKEIPLSTDKKALWDRIHNDIQKEATVRPIGARRRSLYYLAAAAASVAIILAFFFLMPGSMDAYQTALAEQIEVTLPDQSQVLVNADSKVRYNAKKWDQKRLVELNGEAFFKVQKGEKFTVETSQGQVEVLGTAFNVYSRGEDFSVSCQEGRVAVRNNKGEEVILQPGDQVKLENGNLISDEVAIEEVATWRSGIFTFESTAIADIIAEVERQYDVEIILSENIDQEKMTMRFDKSESVQEALRPIWFNYRLTLSQSGRKVTLE